LLPDDSEMVLHVNVRQVLESALAKDIALKDRLKKWLWDLARAPAEDQELLDALGLDLFRDIDSVTVATPRAMDKPLMIVQGKFKADKFQAKADDLVKADLLRAHAIPDGRGTLYETNLPALLPSLYLKLLDDRTLVLSPDASLVREAIDKGTGRNKTHLKRELQALLERTNLTWSVWAVAPGSALAESPLGQGDNLKDLVAKAQDVIAGITIDKDIHLIVNVTARETEDPRTVASALDDVLDKSRGLLALLASSQPEMKPLLAVLRDTKPGVRGKVVTIEAVLPGSDLEKEFPKP
jgi:hypothetical protein